MKHEWFVWKTHSRPQGLTCCRKCGVVKRRDGTNADKPCKGPVGVAPRSASYWTLDMIEAVEPDSAPKWGLPVGDGGARLKNCRVCAAGYSAEGRGAQPILLTGDSDLG